jgi:hypothetical protein
MRIGGIVQAGIRPGIALITLPMLIIGGVLAGLGV